MILPPARGILSRDAGCVNTFSGHRDEPVLDKTQAGWRLRLLFFCFSEDGIVLYFK
jgi:hypothetical protein